MGSSVQEPKTNKQTNKERKKRNEMKKTYRFEEDGQCVLEFFYRSQIPTGKRFRLVERSKVGTPALAGKELIQLRNPHTNSQETYVLETLL